jgi:WD40 repeat protein
VLSAHQAYTRSLAYDPEGKYLASANADGGLCMWEIESGKQQLHRKKACPKVRGGHHVTVLHQPSPNL